MKGQAEEYELLSGKLGTSEIPKSATLFRSDTEWGLGEQEEEDGDNKPPTPLQQSIPYE